MTIDPRSVLLLTLDSCRYDTFATASLPHLAAVGPLHRAEAPSYFTYGSHAAMFVGFTPGVTATRQPFLNPKAGKLFRLAGPAWHGGGDTGFHLEGRTIVEGFARLGYTTIGTGAVRWFDPQTEAGRTLSEGFADFFYPGDTWSIARQLAWIDARLAAARGPVFLFLNVGETHVPYYHDGAPWSRDDSPCVPFQTIDRSAECRLRQRRCLEHVDAALAPLLARFAGATVLACGDHGDCWGEDGLWEHGISHPMTLTVPLVMRVQGVPIVAKDGTANAATEVRSDRHDTVPGGPLETFIERTEGWTSREEARLLYELAREVDSGCIVEIGSYRGRSAVALGRGSLDGHRVPVFAVEPHAPFTGVLGGRFGPPDAGAFHQAMVESGCYHVVRLVSLPSEQAAFGWSTPIALLWIDGDHREEAVRRDVASWWPHLQRGARVVFDDAAEPALGPYRVIEELLARGEGELLQRHGKIAVLRRR